jgi:transcriptional regulator GlxA family with amidase domain
VHGRKLANIVPAAFGVVGTLGAMDDYSIAIFIWNGVEELDFAGPYEVLTAWSRHRADERTITVRTVAATLEPITCSHGLRVLPDVALDDLGHVDLFLHPGGRVTDLLEDKPYLTELISRSGDTLMVSVCNGAVVYAQAGLLEGRPAATHWSAVESLRELGVDVDPDARFVDDGTVVTSAGVSAGIDMALHLIVRLDGEEMARTVRRYIQYDPAPPV